MSEGEIDKAQEKLEKEEGEQGGPAGRERERRERREQDCLYRQMKGACRRQSAPQHHRVMLGAQMHLIGS